MKLPILSLIAVLGLSSVANAHMEISNPAPFRSRHNPYTTDIDYSMTNPLSGSGSDFPCKGYHNLMGTPQGRSVANWRAGSRQTLTVAGSATHNGGSCQASLSYDNGRTWKVIHSWIGNCPLKSNWDFTIPSDAPSGSSIFAWSWHNNIGNREMYMNCAHVTIEGGGGASPGTPFSNRPAMFEANIANGCTTIEGSDVMYPNPGPNVDINSGRTAGPTGTCRTNGRRATALRV